jgi:uncharacterized damage-inducible protein DinB
MSIRESLLPDFDQEMAATRKVLERVPDASLSWRPHEKSFSLAGLATHIASIPHWGEAILERDAYDLAGTGSPKPEQPTLADVLRVFDSHVAAVRRRLIECSDGELNAPWELRNGAQMLMVMPRLTAFRRFLLHHIIHHRGQLTVYLRLQNVALPPVYGPTADERM